MGVANAIWRFLEALGTEAGRAVSEARDKTLLQGWFGHNLHPNLDADANPRDLHWQVAPSEPTVHTLPGRSFAERCNDMPRPDPDLARDQDRGIDR